MARPEPDSDRFRRAYRLFSSDPKKAIAELEDLAREGSILSMLHLGYIYRVGKYVEQNDAEAERRYRQAADAGSLAGNYFLGHLYLRQGKTDLALGEFSYASGKGYPPGTNLLARMYIKGVGVTQDLARGETLLIRASNGGSVAAKALLATLLMKDHHHPLRLLKGVLLRVVSIFEFVVALAIEGRGSDHLR